MLERNSELWDIYTKKEEYSAKELDKHNRFSYANSKYKDIFEPVVSKYLLSNGPEITYPDDRKFAVCLTHDIDDIYPPLRHMLLSSLYCLKHLDFKGLKSQTLWTVNGKKQSPYLNFNHIMEIENKYDAKSSFYFITARKDPLRFRYDIEDVETELGEILDNGCEVGLHGGYYAYDNFESIKSEKEILENILGKKIIGYRNHYLRFKVPDTWELLTKAGFKYDTSFGYPDMIGFRNGMCHPFKPYNLNKNETIDILEIPLVIMDGTLFSYAKSFEDAFNTAKKLIDTVEKHNGVITILWHNNTFSWPAMKYWELLYEKILAYCHSKNAWITSGEEIYNWWLKEGKLSI